MSLGSGGSSSANVFYNSLLGGGTIGGDLVVAGNLEVKKNFEVDGSITISGDLIIDDLSLNSLEVSGNTVLNSCDISALTCINDAQFDTSLNVSGNVNIVQRLNVDGSMNVLADGFVLGALSAGGSIGAPINITGYKLIKERQNDDITPTANGTMYYTTTAPAPGTFTDLLIGASGEYLVSNGTAPQWSAIPPNPTPTLFQVLTAGADASGVSITKLPQISNPATLTISGSSIDLLATASGLGTGTILLDGSFVSLNADNTQIGINGALDAINFDCSNIVVDAKLIDLTTAQTLLRANNGVISAYTLRTTYMGNAGDFVSSATQANNMNLEGGYRDSKNWLYMIGRSSAGATVAYGRIATDKAYFFTGQHPCLIHTHDLSTNHYGLILTSDVDNSGYIQPQVINDSHIVAKLADTPKDKSVYGVLSYYDFVHQTSYSAYIPTENPTGKIYYSNSTGEGMIYVSDLCGNLDAGDYITTSDIAGLGVKQDDDLKHSYTIAKITGSCDFTERPFTYWKYDDPTNPDRTPEQIHEATANKYDVLFGEVYADKWVAYADAEKGIPRFEVQYDFAGLKPSLIGRTFKLALVGCVYQN